jgi:hypothetical protein
VINSGFKSLGDTWVGFFSNIFYDRDVRPDAPKGERFTYDALKEAAEWMNSDPANMPALEFWHLDNLVMGQTTDVKMWGPFIVAEGVWNDTELGRMAKEYFETSDDDWAMSHGFGYQPEDRIKGEYIRFRPRELTVISPDWAANQKTFFKEGNMPQAEDMIRMVAEIFGKSPDEAEKLVEEGLAQQDKAVDGEETAVKSDESAEAEEVEATETEDEAVADDEIAGFAADLLIALNEANDREKKLAAELDDVKGALTEMAGVVEANQKALKALVDERKDFLPKAIKEALNSRVANAEDVDDKTAKDDMKSRQEALADSDFPAFDPASPMEWMKAHIYQK